VRQWRTAYDEAERSLRGTREEVARLESSSQITDRDALYLRSVIVSGFEAGELPRDSTMYAVLSRLLHFTPQEVERISRHAAGGNATAGAGKGGGGYGMSVGGILGGGSAARNRTAPGAYNALHSR
jgi:hypothetical protein